MTLNHTVGVEMVVGARPSVRPRHRGRPRSSTRAAQQITEAFPWDTTPRYMIRDRDAVYGSKVRARVKVIGIEEVVTAPRSPWQNPYVERVIGSIRREFLDHVIVL